MNADEIIERFCALFREHDFEWREEESGHLRPIIYKCSNCEKRVDMAGKGMLKHLPRHERYGCPINTKNPNT